MKKDAYFYYDLISPFAYLFLKARASLEARLNLIPQPIFLPGLLRLQNNRGPAEVAPKREHLYQFCVWRAKKLGIPFQFPPKHPFASAPMQRLLLQHQADWTMIEAAFDFVFKAGRDPEVEWPAFCQNIGLSIDTEKPQSDEIKTALSQRTQAAADAGVFGVPTLVVDGHVFWGLDTIEWVHEFLDNPTMFEDPEYKRARNTENPLLLR